MLFAQQKRRENIAEYILYMFQIEDLIRAFHFDIEVINQQIVSQFDCDNDTKQKMYEWYNNLVIMMQKERLQKRGHLQFIQNHISELEEVHNMIIHAEIDMVYNSLYKSTAGLIREFRMKSKSENGEIGTCIDALYAYLMLKIQKKPVTAETQQAMERFTNFLAKFSQLYKDYEEGNIEFQMD